MEFHALPVIVIIIQQTVKGGGVALFSLLRLSVVDSLSPITVDGVLIINVFSI